MSVEDVMNETRAQLEALLAPINGGVGEDISYDTTFESMKSEVDKLQAIEGGKLDWNGLVSNGAELLSERSKDFRVALYYGAAKGTVGGMKGVLEGLVLLAELNKAFWEPMFPPLKRPRARGNLIGWYSDVLGPVIQGFNPGVVDRPFCIAIDEVSQGLDAEFREKLGEAYPGMGLLREAVRGLIGRMPPEPVAPNADGPPPSSRGQNLQAAMDAATGAGGGGGPSADDIADVESAYRILGQTNELFAKAADVILQADGADPIGYRMSRLSAWLLVNDVPPSDGGKTNVQAPPETLVQGVRDLLGAQNWQGLSNATDLGTTQSPFWLDGVRHLVTALENLGETHAKAKAVVVSELAGLMARAPTLAELSFDDGTPFADDDTKAWLGTIGTSSGGGGASTGSAGPKNTVDKLVGEAKALALEGQLPQAVALLNRAAAQAGSAAQRFKARLELAKICLDGGLPEIASAQLESLDRIAEHHKLVDWEPQLCTELYANLYRARREQSRMSDDPELRNKTSASFERLCQLDATEALRILQS